MAEARIFTKTINGQTVAQQAHTPADAVRLRFNGWREQEPPAEPETPAKKTTTAAARKAAAPKDDDAKS